MLAYAGAGRTTSRLWGTACSPCSRPRAGRAPGWHAVLPGRPRLVPTTSFVCDARGGAPGAGERRGSGDPALPLPRGTARGRALRALNLPYVPVAPSAGATTRVGPLAAFRRARPRGGAQRAADRGGERDDPVRPDLHRAGGGARRGRIRCLDTVLRGEHGAPVPLGADVRGVWSKEHDRAKTEYRPAGRQPLPFKQGKVGTSCPRTSLLLEPRIFFGGLRPRPRPKREVAPEDRRIGGVDRPGGSGRTRCRGGRR